MDKYLKHWDKVLEDWTATGTVPPEEDYWEPQIEKIGLFRELMPEPYIGNPYSCSIVIMNYNPGAFDHVTDTAEGLKAYHADPVHHSRLSDPESMVYHYARNYRERANAGGYLGRGVDPMYDCSGISKSGKCWWCKRLDWIKELVPQSKKLPFAIELCGWHSHAWGNIKYTPALLGRLKGLLAPAIEEAINNSDLGIGICVGAQWSAKILPSFGYRDVTAEVMELPDYKRGWKRLGGTRSYCIMRNDNGTYIISTWKSGFGNMDVPKSEFRTIEKEMIDRINSKKQA